MLHLIDKTDDNDSVKINNMTLIYLFLIKLGPMSEVRLTISLLLFQVVCTAVAFLYDIQRRLISMTRNFCVIL